MYKGREAQEKGRYEARVAQREQDMWDARAPREPYTRGTWGAWGMRASGEQGMWGKRACRTPRMWDTTLRRAGGTRDTRRHETYMAQDT